MKSWLRRRLLSLLADDIELIVTRELVNTSPGYLDGEEVQRLITDNFNELTRSLARVHR